MRLEPVGARLLQTGAVVIAVVIAIGLGSVAASLFARSALGADASTADVIHWVRARPFLPTSISWAVGIPALLALARFGFGIDADVLGLRTTGAPRRGRFVLGLLAGLALILVPAAIAGALGGFVSVGPEIAAALDVPTGRGAVPAIAYVLPALLLAATGEEVLFRSVLLRLWEPVTGVPGAVLLSSLLFVAIHAGNPGASAAGLMGVGLAGVLIGLLFVLSGSLALVAGLHLGWNLAEAVVMGLPVSGYALPSLFRLEVADSDLARSLLGGSFGPEEGIVFHASLAIALAALVIREQRARLSRPGIEDPGA